MKVVILTALAVILTVSMYAAGSHSRTGGGPELSKIKAMMLKEISNINGILAEMIAEVKNADAPAALIELFEHKGAQLKVLVKKMYESGQKYEDKLEADEEFIKKGEVLAGKLYSLAWELEEAVTEWRQLHTLNKTDEAALQEAWDKFYHSPDIENEGQ